MALWVNNDQLVVKLGPTEAISGVAGEYGTFASGAQHVVEITLGNLTTLTGSQVIQEENVFLPAGGRIEKVEVITTTASTSGGSATLSVGMIRMDRTTNVSATGFVNALALASIDTAGKTTVLTTGATSAGTLIGTTLANPGYITAQFGTAAFTAGKVVVRIFWTNPT